MIPCVSDHVVQGTSRRYFLANTRTIFLNESQFLHLLFAVHYLIFVHDDVTPFAAGVRSIFTVFRSMNEVEILPALKDGVSRGGTDERT
jgi:hypothetical protein